MDTYLHTHHTSYNTHSYSHTHTHATTQSYTIHKHATNTSHIIQHTLTHIHTHHTHNIPNTDTLPHRHTLPHYTHHTSYKTHSHTSHNTHSHTHIQVSPSSLPFASTAPSFRRSGLSQQLSIFTAVSGSSISIRKEPSGWGWVRRRQFSREESHDSERYPCFPSKTVCFWKQQLSGVELGSTAEQGAQQVL